MIKGFVINYVKNILEFFALYLSMLFPRDRRTIIFGAWWGNKYDDNSKYLFEYVVKNRPDLNAVWLSDNDNVVKEIIKKGYPAYHSKSLKAILLALRARYSIIVTSWYGGDYGFIVNWFLGGAVFIDLWHGVPLKKIMYDDEFSLDYLDSFSMKMDRILKGYPRKRHYHFATSEAIVNTYISCFRSDREHVLNLGQARNDYFYNEHINPLRERYKGRKIIVYMPTHRKEGKNKIEVWKLLDLKKINQLCYEKSCLFVIKKHYYHRLETEPLKDLAYVVDLTNSTYSSQEMLDAADILITDYSSCYIDHLLLNKPQIFYGYDLDDYLANDRGMYENFVENAPGPICTNKNELMSAMENFLEGNDAYKTIREKKRDYYYSPCNQCAVAENQLNAIMDL